MTSAVQVGEAATSAVHSRAAHQPLADVAENLSRCSGAWVCIEWFGVVVCHGPGRAPCPPALAASILGKTSRPFREAVVWRRPAKHGQGLLDGVPVLALELGYGATAWLVGDHGLDLADARRLLSDAVNGDARPAIDPFVEGLLHPRGMSVAGRAPAAQLLLLRSELRTGQLIASARVATVGLSARLQTHDDSLLVALPVAACARAVVDRVRKTCPGTVAGLSHVRDGATDWVAAAGLAKACLEAAQRLDIPLGGPGDPAVAAEVLLHEACQASSDFAAQLDTDPLSALKEHDRRNSGHLVASLRAWCETGFDIPAAAEALGVHTNTLRYRIKRGHEVSGLDLKQSRQKLALHLLLTSRA